MVRIAQGGWDERTARMLLAVLSEPGDSVTGRMLDRLGGVETVGLLDREDAAPGVGSVETQVWRKRLLTRTTEGLREKVASFEGLGYGTVIPGDENWPAALEDLHERAPYVLWTSGAASFLSRPSEDLVTITGARASTGYGEHVASELASDMSDGGRIVVSGGAYGIENAAHRSVLAAGGDTIAVLASGADRSYPQGQKDLLDRVRGVGLVVSELPPGTTPTKWRFLARNRLLAALSSATVVVEAGYRSGSLNVAGHAEALGRAVGAVPGPVTSVSSAGTHRLIRDGIAKIITDGEDVRAMIKHHAEVPVVEKSFEREAARRSQPPHRSL
ncbi:Rossmann fold nucleotide-binding protein Smf possibly involved in DNA uptake [Microbacterium esteraromaticum]|uniref:Rossmann fold nucleotide-binding protein Smf possibly involved in DNA uptake n=1 Tax=Microbacterium esteraromaticum TaxID=57043 RepID=A0A1R4I777_9MICO|nr:DNA-processing protein DprA [Microbacterium esteraromaticum]SJN15731.1 Rossmann fold nucleotide-binding protein Smf possibly involved in DNA uptake [Microbacterium esteraromaticum]